MRNNSILIFTASRIICSKKPRNETKQTVQFKLEDTFFLSDAKGNLRQLPRNVLDEDILSVDGATLKLYNKEWMDPMEMKTSTW